MATPFSGELRLQGLDGAIEALKQLPAEIVSRRGGVVKSALRKGAVVIFKQEKANLQAVTANATSENRRLSTGFLEKNLIVSRGKAPADGNGERYLIRIRRKTYPDSKGTTTLKTAQLLEHGSSQQPAEPWIMPAFKSKAGEAIRTVEAETIKGIARVVKQLAAKTKGR